MTTFLSIRLTSKSNIRGDYDKFIDKYQVEQMNRWTDEHLKSYTKTRGEVTKSHTRLNTVNKFSMT